jgi:class 3 adenylate cyclase
MLGPACSQSGEYASADGTAMLASTAGLRTVPWGLVAQIPEDVAYASITRMTYIVAGTVAGAMLLALALGLFVARRISAPLAELTRFSGALSRREFDDRAKVRTKDELAVLGRAMNGAAADLKASEARIREEVAIRTDLGRYIPGELVDQIVRRERDMALGGTRRPITVLFADVVGFTPLTDKLEPEQVVAILNELFTILTQIVFRHRGMVDKFVGDCVMAVWGAPTAQDDHATRAVTAADEMLSWLETGNERWKEKYGIQIQLAIGINTGEAVVGNVGSEKRMEYTAIGDVVNVAARLESIARPQQILVTEAVKAAVGDAFEFDDADLHRLSGRPQPVHLWAVRT